MYLLAVTIKSSDCFLLNLEHLKSEKLKSQIISCQRIFWPGTKITVSFVGIISNLDKKNLFCQVKNEP